jgi:hypothetical protein
MHFHRRRSLSRRIDTIERQLTHMATQEEVDAITTQVSEVATDLATAKTTLQAEIDQLATANPGIDLTGLKEAVAPLDQAAKDLAALAPDAPTG